MPPTDHTPRDVHGEPLQAGRWYWVRRDLMTEVMACVELLHLYADDYADVSCDDEPWLIASWQWLPADGPPAWPGEAPPA